MGGYIHVESQVGDGATFIFRIAIDEYDLNDLERNSIAEDLNLETDDISPAC